MNLIVLEQNRTLGLIRQSRTAEQNPQTNISQNLGEYWKEWIFND
jgi:hypothetical protein